MENEMALRRRPASTRLVFIEIPETSIVKLMAQVDRKPDIKV